MQCIGSGEVDVGAEPCGSRLRHKTSVLTQSKLDPPRRVLRVDNPAGECALPQGSIETKGQAAAGKGWLQPVWFDQDWAAGKCRTRTSRTGTDALDVTQRVERYGKAVVPIPESCLVQIGSVTISENRHAVRWVSDQGDALALFRMATPQGPSMNLTLGVAFEPSLDRSGSIEP